MSAKAIYQWVSETIKLFILKVRWLWVKRKLKKQLFNPWGQGWPDPFTFGPPFTTKLRYGYRLWLWYYTPVRRRLADWGSYIIVTLGVYWWIFIESVHETPLLWSVSTTSLPPPAAELFLDYLFETALYVLIWRLLCKKLTIIKITPSILEAGLFRWWSIRTDLVSGYDLDSSFSAYGDSCFGPRLWRMWSPRHNAYYNVYRLSVRYAGQKCLIAQICGYETAEALRNKLWAIHDFLSSAQQEYQNLTTSMEEKNNEEIQSPAMGLLDQKPVYPRLPVDL